MLARVLLVSACLLSLAATGSSQTVWTVTAQNGVQSAINAAAPGDVIDLVGSVFGGFVVDKGVSIRAHGTYVGWGSPNAIVVNVPPGQLAHLDELQTSWLDVQGGNVRIDRSTFIRVTASGGQVVMVECRAIPFPPFANLHSPDAGIAASNSVLGLRDCEIRGSNAGVYSSGPVFAFMGPTSALRISNGTTVVHAERCVVTGGNGGSALGGFPSAGPAAAVDLWFGSSGSFADCALTGGSGSGPYPPAGGTSGGGAFAFRDTTLVVGSPSNTTSVANNAPLVAMELTPVWTRGMTSTLRVRALPHEPHAVFATPATSAQVISLVVEPVFAGGAFVILAGLNDAAGLAAYSVPVPNVPALLHAPVWCQAVGGVSLPMRASVIAGGLVR